MRIKAATGKKFLFARAAAFIFLQPQAVIWPGGSPASYGSAVREERRGCFDDLATQGI